MEHGRGDVFFWKILVDQQLPKCVTRRILNLLDCFSQKNMLEDKLKTGAQGLLAQAVELELQDLLETYRYYQVKDGCQAVGRNGFLPEHSVQTGLGDIANAS